MKPTIDKIVKAANQFIVHGSYGDLLVDATTGAVLQYHIEPTDEVQHDSYEDIVKFDVAEFVSHYGEIEDTDILCIGFTTDTGYYESPARGNLTP